MKMLYDTQYKQSPWVTSDTSYWQTIVDERHLKLHSVKKGTIVYHQGSPQGIVYLVKSGRVNLSIFSEEGDEKCLFVIGKGSVFGEIALLSDSINCAQAVAMTYVELYQIPGEFVLDLLETSLAMNQEIIQILVKKAVLLTSQLEQLCFFDSELRVKESLSYLMEQFGKRDKDGGIMIEMKFTHQEMANLIGTSRVTVTNIFLEMEREGLIEKRKKGIYVRDPQRFREHS